MMKEYIKLIRPPLFLLGFLASWALLVRSGLWGTEEALFIFLAVGFGNAAFTVFNEIHDIKQDRINKPWKPLPSGKVPVSHAIFIAVVFYAISLISLLYLLKYSVYYVLCGFIGYTTASIYNVIGRREVLGNACLGFTYAIAAYMSTALTDLIFSVSFGLLTVAHNIMVQIQDLEADRRAGVVTLPQIISLRLSRLISGILSTTACAVFLYLAQMVFALATMLILVSIVFKQHIEALIRWGVRLMILLGFLVMVIEHAVLHV